MKLRNLKYCLFILEILSKWAIIMIGPFIPLFGWFIIYNYLLYALDKQHLEQKTDMTILFTALAIHIIFIISMVFMMQ